MSMRFEKTKSDTLFHSESGNILLIVIIIIFGLGFLGLVISRLVISENMITTIDADKNKAFYIAETGVEYAVSMLTDSGSWRGTGSDIIAAGGSFSILIEDSTSIPSLGDTLLVRSIGKSTQIGKTLQVKLLEGEDGWSNVLTAGENIDFSSGKGTINGDMHANDQVSIGSKYTVNGNVTGPPPTVSMPVIDWDFFRNAASADSQYFTTDIHLEVGNSPYSGVWYTTQNIVFDDNSIIVYGTLVAEGNIDIMRNNIEIYATPQNYPAILCGNDLTIYFNNTIIRGFVYSDNDILLEKNNGIITGALFAAGTIRNSANNSVFTIDPDCIVGLVSVSFDSTYIQKYPPEIVSWEEL